MGTVPSTLTLVYHPGKEKLLSISNNLYIPENQPTVAYRRLLYTLYISRKVGCCFVFSPGILVVPWFLSLTVVQAVVGEVDEEIDSRIDLSSGKLRGNRGGLMVS